MQIIKNHYLKHYDGDIPLISGIRLRSRKKLHATEPKPGCKNWNLVTEVQFINCDFHPNCSVYRFRACGFHDCSGTEYLDLEECEVVD